MDVVFRGNGAPGAIQEFQPAAEVGGAASGRAAFGDDGEAVRAMFANESMAVHVVVTSASEYSGVCPSIGDGAQLSRRR